jgi:hypothetical protein
VNGGDVSELDSVFRRLSTVDVSKSEASIQSDIRLLFLLAELDLSSDDVRADLEVPAEGGRIDILVAQTVIEVKRDLKKRGVEDAAIAQLAGYIRSRKRTHGGWHNGILTDGVEWRFVQMNSEDLPEVVGRFTLTSELQKSRDLLAWLRAVVGSTPPVAPTPEMIVSRLGAESPEHSLDGARLANLYAQCRDHPEVVVKRQLWAKLLQTALGTNFKDTDELFLNHTLLVILAEMVAHALVGLDIRFLDPDAIVSGREFTKARIGGVVEQDFFDWPLSVQGGDQWIRTIATRISGFDWSLGVEHDVLKILYESIITAKQRHALGEYYTPDWLAERMVEETIDAPLKQRVHDPACGSGTFLFHAARHYLSSSEANGVPTQAAIQGLVHHVSGVDVHPVAVTLARVTYLLAIGQERLQSRERPAFNVPVYLGDSLSWQQETSILSGDALVIPTTDGAEFFEDQLVFPAALLDDADTFDTVVSELADRATNPNRSPLLGKKGAKPPSIMGLLKPLSLTIEDQRTLERTFRKLCELHDLHRNHIWGYYARNLARPMWLSFEKNNVDILIGNPPWLTYNDMTPDMQEAFRARSKDRGLWSGARNHDLSLYFVVRSVERYLKRGGKFAFVLPLATLSRQYAQGFRSGNWSGTRTNTYAAFLNPWDLDGVKPPIFPVPSCVVMGSRSHNSPEPLPQSTKTFSGNLPGGNVSWSVAAGRLSIGIGTSTISSGAQSPYASEFEAGAKIDPRVLFVVEAANPSPLGAPAGTRRVQSRRTNLEKDPWKSTPSIVENVEEQFLRPLLLGESIVPFRIVSSVECVTPWLDGRLLTTQDDNIDSFPGLADWWKRAEQLRLLNRSSTKFSLNERYNFQTRLSRQLTHSAGQKVVYTKSGSILTACRVSDSRTVIDQMLYWSTVKSNDEALYLCGIFNSPAFTRAVAPYQSRGQFGTRHFDKYVFELPIPRFDGSNHRHIQLVDLARRGEDIAVAVDLPLKLDFKRQRRIVRDALEDSAVFDELDASVHSLLNLK